MALYNMNKIELETNVRLGRPTSTNRRRRHRYDLAQYDATIAALMAAGLKGEPMEVALSAIRQARAESEKRKGGA